MSVNMEEFVDTPEAALREGRLALEGLIESYLERGEQLPSPGAAAALSRPSNRGPSMHELFSGNGREPRPLLRSARHHVGAARSEYCLSRSHRRLKSCWSARMSLRVEQQTMTETRLSLWQLRSFLQSIRASSCARSLWSR